ncbi:MAG: hypothetical protein HC844_04385 [Tabrizicola sp.]|nr:hypothetical protein [Tabrizicola sp.]
MAVAVETRPGPLSFFRRIAQSLGAAPNAAPVRGAHFTVEAERYNAASEKLFDQRDARARAFPKGVTQRDVFVSDHPIDMAEKVLIPEFRRIKAFVAKEMREAGFNLDSPDTEVRKATHSFYLVFEAKVHREVFGKLALPVFFVFREDGLLDYEDVVYDLAPDWALPWQRGKWFYKGCQSGYLYTSLSYGEAVSLH